MHWNEVEMEKHYAYLPPGAKKPIEVVAVSYSKGEGWTIQLPNSEQITVRPVELVSLWEHADAFMRDRETAHDFKAGSHEVLERAFEMVIEGFPAMDGGVVSTRSWGKGHYEFVFNNEDIRLITWHAETDWPTTRPHGLDGNLAVEASFVREAALRLVALNPEGVRNALDAQVARYPRLYERTGMFAAENRTYADAVDLICSWLVGAGDNTPPSVLRTWAQAKAVLRELLGDGTISASDLVDRFDAAPLPSADGSDVPSPNDRG